MAYIDELERAAWEARYPSPKYPIGVKNAEIPANKTLEDYIDTVSGDGFAKDSDLATTNSKLDGFFPFAAITGSCANDAAAQSAGVPVGGLYHTSGTVKVRLV